MSFVMPSEYWSEGGLSDAPRPLPSSGGTVSRKEGEDRAAVMFGGFAGRKDVEERERLLIAALEKDKEWKASDGAVVTLAQYNDPFTPPWKRRNEVTVLVVPR